MMRVESLIKRPLGHEVTLAGVSYAFRPPDWACRVENPAHAAHFGAIKEGYRVVPEPLALELEVPGGMVSRPLAPPIRRRGRPRKVVTEVATDGDI